MARKRDRNPEWIWKWDRTKTDFVPRSRKFEDLTGRRFGKLVAEYPIRTPDGVILWHCRCDCGGTKLAMAKDLKKGTVSTCGCYWRWDRTKTDFIPRNSRFKDLTGRRFGSLVAQYPLRSAENGVVWHCLCDCGQTVDVLSRKLRSKRITSCGCRQEPQSEIEAKGPGKWDNDKTNYIPRDGEFTDLTGKRFGKLVVQYPQQSPDGVVLWFCACDCGGTKQALGRDLLAHVTTSCGCEPEGRAPSPQESSGLSWLSDLEHLSAEYLEKLWEQQGRRCALSGLPVVIGQNAALDCMDTDKGEVPGNVRWLHEEIKNMKGDLNDLRFCELCASVSAYTSDRTVGGKRK